MFLKRKCGQRALNGAVEPHGELCDVQVRRVAGLRDAERQLDTVADVLDGVLRPEPVRGRAAGRRREGLGQIGV